ncbi:segregation/condensation protein A [Streptococcus loxodontisalivarius]|uniref:Segregation and condensation protein A n=1 Tax=Streptococcus loxodontisalivarius TaxID=1349415 RepID=A0ABS2PQQ5_9STRE|nr:segregation/condensation protein A [Streptococcus loxodontisalivarius]MBM7642372.1 segregation and condensation protein A [Streptococcus loxodontisalivarius]
MDIKFKDFEGPLDLLLHLVSKYEVDIYDVPLVEVIEQYLAYIATLQAMKLEIAGEYMVMASQLMLIKSRKLLPKMVEEISYEDDLEADLLSQIEEYKRFKALGQELAAQHDQRAKFYSKPKTELISDEMELKYDKTVVDLFLAFSKVMADKQDSFNDSHTTVAADQYRIEDMMAYVEERFSQKKRLTLSELFEASQNTAEMLTIFLASLELIKRQYLTVHQEENFGEITLMKEVA